MSCIMIYSCEAVPKTISWAREPQTFGVRKLTLISQILDNRLEGEIEIFSWCQFHASGKSLNKSFKPVPDGFPVDNATERYTLLKGKA